MLDAITSVPAVAGVALATAALFIRDMLEGEKLRPTANARQGAAHGVDAGAAGTQVARPARYRWYGLVCAAILLVLVVLRFITLAG